MSITQYRFNLDVIEYTILNAKDCHVPYVPMLKSIRLTVQEQIYLRRGMFSKLGKIIRLIDTIRAKHGQIFIRLSSISAKDQKFDWVSWTTEQIMQTFIHSWRIQEDLDEALQRQSNVSLCILPWKTFTIEYRTFVLPDKHWTRDELGTLINQKDDNRFESWAKQLKDKIAPPFVFDMGESLEFGLTFIECNQFDEETDLYLPLTGIPKEYQL